MKISHALVAALAAGTLLALPAMAAAATDTGLPQICRSQADGGMDMSGMDMGGTTTGTASTAAPGAAQLDQAHQDLMRGMDAMDAQMMQGMQAQDLDVAFICGMIPHHQGAIDMARAELAHGTDPFARALAQDIIASQQKQIDDMRAWLAKQPK
jgi:uncharacterized protein (DUF305 family)